MRHDGRRGRNYTHINGVPRNTTSRLTDDELKAMGAELKVTRHTDGKTERQRRIEHVIKNGGIDIKPPSDIK